MNYEDAITRYITNSLSGMKEGDIFTLPYPLMGKDEPDVLRILNRKVQEAGMVVRLKACDANVGVVCVCAAIK